MLSSVECQPARILQIVSGSRSGSSLLKTVLAKSPSVVSLAGEEEPYIKMSGNGYGLTSDSDALIELKNPSLFRRLLATELLASSPWEWRLRLQYRGKVLARLLDDLPNLNPTAPWEWLAKNGAAGYYDGCPAESRLPFREMTYEMLPYVLPRVAPQEPVGSTLLLKAPYNVYRAGVLERVFPTAQFSYIYLLRDPAATINGLIDGWKASYGFHKHLTPHGWWKFDLPPRWKEYWNAPIAERAWLQWESSYSLIADRLLDGSPVVRFEQLVADPKRVIADVCRRLEILPPEIDQLPRVMVTEAPDPSRWKKRWREIIPLLRRSALLVNYLGYRCPDA